MPAARAGTRSQRGARASQSQPGPSQTQRSRRPQRVEDDDDEDDEGGEGGEEEAGGGDDDDNAEGMDIDGDLRNDGSNVRVSEVVG